MSKLAEAIVGLHMDPSRPVGTIAVREGALTAICDEMYIDIQGRGGHAARPHESLDPIAAAAHLISTVYQFVPRRTDSHEAVVVSFGHISGGDNANEIAGRRPAEPGIAIEITPHARHDRRGYERVGRHQPDAEHDEREARQPSAGQCFAPACRVAHGRSVALKSTALPAGFRHFPRLY